MSGNAKGFKHSIFWPVFLTLAVALVISAIAPSRFQWALSTLNHEIVHRFTPLFCLVAASSLLTCLWICISPLGKMRIGGAKAVPVLTRFQWFSIALCTTTAAGILFWSMAEPIFHYHAPPTSLRITPATREAELFAMRTLYHHWALVPCALYTLFGALFAFVFYQMNLPFSLSSCLHPLLPARHGGKISHLIDGVSLFALVAGMAASMGSGILMLAGGFHHITGIPSSPWVWLFFGALIVTTFVASALSGLTKGIQLLSNINVKFFAALTLFILVAGPTSYFFTLGIEAFQQYIPDILPNTFLVGFSPADPWPESWTVFYWANWLAWTPITAIFLARIGYGYTYRQFVFMNLFLPAFLCGCWVTLFGGTALAMESSSTGFLQEILKAHGAEAMTFAVLGKLPWAAITVPALLFTAFLAYVTAADSNTVAMAGLCSHGIEPESPEPPQNVKIIWGVTTGFLSVAALTASGLDGVRELSILGGFPVLFMELIAVVNLLRISIAPGKFQRVDIVENAETPAPFAALSDIPT